MFLLAKLVFYCNLVTTSSRLVEELLVILRARQ
jgi:hypothetical protein